MNHQEIRNFLINIDLKDLNSLKDLLNSFNYRLIQKISKSFNLKKRNRKKIELIEDLLKIELFENIFNQIKLSQSSKIEESKRKEIEEKRLKKELKEIRNHKEKFNFFYELKLEEFRNIHEFLKNISFKNLKKISKFYKEKFRKKLDIINYLYDNQEFNSLISQIRKNLIKEKFLINKIS